MRILFIEDDPAFALLVQRLIANGESWTPETQTVGSMADALDALGRDGFDAIVTDLGLPDSRGAETLERLRTAAPATPIVVLTALDDTRYGLDMVTAGADDFLSKDGITPQVLERALRYSIERRRSLTELRRTTALLRAANAQLDRFAAVTAHEFKSPLSLLQFHCDMILRCTGRNRKPDGTVDVERVDSSASAMRQEVRGMAGVVDALLQLARSGQFEADATTVDLTTTVRDVAAFLEPEYSPLGGAIEVGALPETFGNGAALAQLFRNLFVNAKNYRAERPPLVRVEGSVRESEVVVHVHDNGSGVAEDKWESIFDAFHREHDSVAGSGLGLALCRRIALAHGGTIRVMNSSGEGTTFELRLPLPGA